MNGTGQENERGPLLAIRYCGGCNPYYDAALAAETIQRELGMPLPPWRGGQLPQICVLLKQCRSSCFPDPDALSTCRTLVITGIEDIPDAVKTIRNLIKEKQGYDEQRAVY